MKCLMCGADMYLVRDRWTDSEKEGSIYDSILSIFRENEDPDKSEWWACSGNKEGHQCFGDDYPLIKHGVGGGLKSAPGDSWSLTWQK